ncbi:porin family protein [Flavobacterium sp.]|uniref:porin family protein n=1 Tax=Flavobacterium sp. TaxID=239 RepID=UPI0026359F60|nr:porin family protein [Flavobacterium sp.]MDD2985767.1 porin family protein [Flavobacterium sp.]
MKKIILTIMAFAAFGTANAQDIKFGVKAGANFSNFTGDADVDGRTGFYIGGLADFTVSEKFHVQPEVLYSMEGGKDAELDFVRIPIMAKYYVMDGLNLQAGPMLGFKIGGEDGLDEATKSLDYGLGFGAAYELPIGVFFDLRYNLGLANISDNDMFDLGTTAFQVGLGYRF